MREIPAPLRSTLVGAGTWSDMPFASAIPTNRVDLVCGRNEFQFTRHLCDTELASTLIMGRGDLR